jgi:hypothetical protein
MMKPMRRFVTGGSAHRVLGDHGHSLMRAVADVDEALEATR